MTRFHQRSARTTLSIGLLRSLAFPTLLILGLQSAHAEVTISGVPYTPCANGTVALPTGTTGPYNPNDPSADPCYGHGGAAGINDPAHNIPLDASATTLVCRDETAGAPAHKKVSVKTTSTITKTSLEAEQDTSTKGAGGKGNDPHFAQSCDTVTMCANGQLKCSVDDLVTFKVGFPEIDASDVNVDNIGIAHNILLDGMVSRIQDFQAAGGAVDDVVLTNVYRSVAKELHAKQSKASLGKLPDLDEVRATVATPLAESFKTLCQSTGKSAAQQTCSNGFADLMITYGELLDDLDDYDFDGARALVSDLREDAELTLSGSERDAARIFANVYDASMTYWGTQDFDVTLRASGADANGTFVYYVVNSFNGPYNGDLDADAATFGSICSVLATVKFP